MSWNLSCLDWEERIRSGRSLVPDLPLNIAAGERAVAVFNKLRLHDVTGTPTLAEAGGEWFRDVIRALFGSLDPVTNERLIREVFLLVPKKNSKTTNGALLMLDAFLLNERPYAPFGMTAPVQDVSDIAFSAVAGAIALDRVLSKKLHVREHLKTIVDRETKADLRIMTFDPAVLTGQKWVGLLVDELHVVAKMARAASAIRQIRGGMLPFPEAFLAFITTQSEEAPVGVFKAELMKARAIRDGRQEGAMLPVLYEFPESMQRDRLAWRDPVNWSMVTPNAGKSVKIDRLVEEMAAAESSGEDELRAWASQHLNVEIGLALKSNAWAGALFWEQQEDPRITLEYLLERSEVVVVGGDGGGLDDLLGLAVLGRERDTGDWLAWFHAWAHPSVMERRKSESERFLDFAKAGDLTIVDEIGDDVKQVADIIERIESAGLLDRFGVDPHGVSDLVEAVATRLGWSPEETAKRIVGISQGWKLVGAIKTTERRLAAGALRVAKSLMMPWCVGNAKVEPRGNAVIITKQASGTAKIDPLMALFDAVSLMALNPEARNSIDGWLKAAA